MKYGFHVSFIQQMVLVSVSMVVICANWLTDYFASKNGGATTIFKLRMRERTVRMRDVKRDDLLQDTALVFVTAGDGDMVACVPARITGRCARVNHSTQEYVGAEVPVADTGGACPMHQRSHGVRPPLSPPPSLYATCIFKSSNVVPSKLRKGALFCWQVQVQVQNTRWSFRGLSL